MVVPSQQRHSNLERKTHRKVIRNLGIRMVHVGVKARLLVGFELVGQRGGRDVRRKRGQ